MKSFSKAVLAILVAALPLAGALAEERSRKVDPDAAKGKVRSTLGWVTPEELAEKNGLCQCGFDLVGSGLCYSAEFCPPEDERCSSNADCLGGEACVFDSCCTPGEQEGICVLQCDGGECINPTGCGGDPGCELPLFVSLASFDATVEDGQVKLSWRTAVEIDNVGFRILRARAGGSRVKPGDVQDPGKAAAVQLDLISAAMIAPKGTGLSGATYEFIDGSPQEAGIVSYYLQDVDTLGKATLHGPVTIYVPPTARIRNDR